MLWYFYFPSVIKKILSMILGLASSYVDLCITDVPDTPAITSVRLESDSLRSSWDYVTIPTVDVTLYWSLSFFRPSQLSNMTTTLLNTNTYNYTLQGVRSCDPFRLCIRAENELGSSSWFCNNDALPYSLQSEDIEHFLVQVNEAFSLNVTVMVRQYYCVVHFKSNVAFQLSRYLNDVSLQITLTVLK